jgi:Zn-finger nucleic acid-binding protein
MDTREVHGVDVCLCAECGGLWLDNEKLKELTDFDLRAGRILNCFRCGLPMVTQYVNEVEIDICPKCLSIWLDTGEIEKITGLDFARGRILECPGCMSQLQTKMLEGVEVDVCPNCTGIFLDRGELERLSGIEPHETKKMGFHDFLNDVHYVRAIFAMSLYRSGKHDMQKAADIAGMPLEEFEEFLEKNKQA